MNFDASPPKRVDPNRLHCLSYSCALLPLPFHSCLRPSTQLTAFIPFSYFILHQQLGQRAAPYPTMSTRTAHWVSRTTPGAPPPPPSRAASAHPPPTIYPESSVSNPNASRYTGRSSRLAPQSYSSSSHSRSYSASPPPAGSRYSSSSRSHARSNSHSGSHRSSYRGSSPLATPVDTYYAPPQEPVIARTSGADGRTDSYMIIPGKGQRVEILVRIGLFPSHMTANPLLQHPTPAASTRYAHYSTSSTKEKPLLKKLFGKVEWGDKRSR